MTEKNNDTEKRPENIFVKMIRDLLLGCVALAPLSLFIFLFYNLFYFCNVFIGAIFGVTNSRYTTAFICIFLAVVLIYIGAKLRRRERSLLNIVEYYVKLVKMATIGWAILTIIQLIRQLRTMVEMVVQLVLKHVLMKNMTTLQLVVI